MSLITKGFVDNNLITQGFGPSVVIILGPGFYTLPIPERLKERYDFEDYEIKVGIRNYDSDKVVVWLARDHKGIIEVNVPVGSLSFENLLAPVNVYTRKREIFLNKSIVVFSELDNDFVTIPLNGLEVYEMNKDFGVMLDE